MAKMSWSEKESRRQARYWGKACLSNLDWALRSEENARLWSRIADRMEGRPDHESAIEHARHQAEVSLGVAEHQTGQTFVNARRAFHAAIEARDGRG